MQEWIDFKSLLKTAKLSKDSKGDNRTIYSLHYACATLRLQNGSNIYWLKKNMGTSLAQIEIHYGQINVLVGIKFETAKRQRRKKGDVAEPAINVKELPKQPIRMDDVVPNGAGDLTPAYDATSEGGLTASPIQV